MRASSMSRAPCRTVVSGERVARVQRAHLRAGELARVGAADAVSPRVLAIALHPYLTGTAHRITVLDRILAYARTCAGACFMTASELLDEYVAQVPRRGATAHSSTVSSTFALPNA